MRDDLLSINDASGVETTPGLNDIKNDSADGIFWSIVDHRPEGRRKEIDISNEYIAKMNLIIDEVYKQFNQDKKDIFVDRKNYIKVKHHKQAFQYLAKKYLNEKSPNENRFSNIKIANYIGKESHATVLHNSKYIENVVQSKDTFSIYIKNKIFSIEIILRQRLYGESYEIAKEKIYEDYSDIGGIVIEEILDTEDMKKIDNVIDLVCQQMNKRKEDVLGISQKHAETLPRQVIYYLTTEYLEIPPSIVAQYTGKASQSVIWRCHKKIGDLLTNKNFKFEGKPFRNIIFDLDVEVRHKLFNQPLDIARKEATGKYGNITTKETSKPIPAKPGSLLEEDSLEIVDFQDIKKILGYSLYKELQIEYFWSDEAFLNIPDEESVEHIKYLFLVNENVNLFELWRKKVFYNPFVIDNIERHNILNGDQRFEHIRTAIYELCTLELLDKIASVFEINKENLFLPLPSRKEIEAEILEKREKKIAKKLAEEEALKQKLKEDKEKEREKKKAKKNNTSDNENIDKIYEGEEEDSEDEEENYDEEKDNYDDIDKDIKVAKNQKLHIKAAKKAHKFMLSNYMNISKEELSPIQIIKNNLTKTSVEKKDLNEKWLHESLGPQFQAIERWAMRFFNKI